MPLGFVSEGNTLFLVARERAAQWPVDALRRGSVELELAGASQHGTICLLPDPTQRVQVLEKFRQKYGDEAYRRWYEHPARVLRVDFVEAPPPNGGENAYQGWLESEFDNVADDYDRHITGNRMNLLLRNRSLAQLSPTFAQAHRLLEVGCGSGMETLPLLREGHEVVAVDVSQRMLDVVREKARREGIGERLSTRKLRAAEIGQLIAEDGRGAFDGAYSTYGALNCEPDLTGPADGFAALVAPGAAVVLGIYNRWCFFELAGYLLSLQPHRAFGRRRNPIPVGASRFCIDVYAYSVREVVARFSRAFTPERLEGVPVVLPPSDLTAYSEKFSRHFDQLAALDASLGARWPWRSLGDHFLLTLRRNAFPRPS